MEIFLMKMQLTLKPKPLQSMAIDKDHPILKRLAQEITNGEMQTMCPHSRYDRTHNRHNRG